MYFCFINFYFDRRNQKSKGESLYRLKKSTLINIEVLLEKISAYCRKIMFIYVRSIEKVYYITGLFLYISDKRNRILRKIRQLLNVQCFMRKVSRGTLQ